MNLRFFWLLIFVGSSVLLRTPDLYAEETKKKWTILVFLNADNNLNDAGFDDIREMEKVGSTADVNVVVQLDSEGDRGTRRLLIEKAIPTSDKGRWGPSDETFSSPILEDLPEQDMGSAQTLVEFVTWGVQKFPAENYFVILWNHGSGWSKEDLDRTGFDKSISYDDTSNSHIRTNELATAFDEITALTGERMRMIGFDACLMGMVEVADSLVGLADFMIGSEENEPADGYPYDTFLATFDRSKDKSPEALARILVEEYGKSYSGGTQGQSPVTQSAFDLRTIPLLKRRIDSWVSSVRSSKELQKETIVDAIDRTVNFGDPSYRDLGHLVSLVMDELTQGEGGATEQEGRGETLLSTSIRLRKAIRDTVIANFNSKLYSDALGISIYLPYSNYGGSPWGKESHRVRTNNYRELSFSRSSFWPDFLDYLFSEQDEFSVATTSFVK